MKKITGSIPGVFIALFLSVSAPAFSQAVQSVAPDDESLLTVFEEPIFVHSAEGPSIADYNKYKKLIYKKPAAGQYDEYYHLACALWEMKKIKEAENLFLGIEQSSVRTGDSISYAADTLLFSDTSHVQNCDSTKAYKNAASIYLAKICIERKQYKEALQWLNLANIKYPIMHPDTDYQDIYSSGIRHLYVLCYKALDQPTELINLQLPYWFDWDNQSLITAIQQQYSPEEITRYLLIADSSIDCTAVNLPCSINLFGQPVQLPSLPALNNKNTTRDSYAAYFRSSSFYKELRNY